MHVIQCILSRQAEKEKPDSPVSWQNLFTTADHLVSCFPPATSRKQFWLNKINEIRLWRLLASLKLDNIYNCLSDDAKEVCSQLDQVVDNLCDGQLPEVFPGLSNLSLEERRYLKNCYRPLFVELGLHSIPDQQWIRRLAGLIGAGNCLEICAGRGWLARELKALGVSVRATDTAPSDPVTDVEAVGAETATHQAPNFDYLIISWPPTHSPLAAKCVRALKPDTKIIYIGEWLDGSCATDEFFEQVEILEKIEIPCWFGFSDAVYLLRKKSLNAGPE
ncbi:MAG: hypothetical protein ACR2PT_09975 [Endozoicomonas sp.]